MLYQSGTFLLLLILVLAMGEDNYVIYLHCFLYLFFISSPCFFYIFYWCILFNLLIVESVLNSFHFLKIQGFWCIDDVKFGLPSVCMKVLFL